VIVSSDTVLCVRAVVLLGQVLHLASLLLPHEIGSLSQSLPQLAQHVATQHYVSQQYCTELEPRGGHGSFTWRINWFCFVPFIAKQNEPRTHSKMEFCVISYLDMDSAVKLRSMYIRRSITKLPVFSFIY
jgi:hypothetical protein